MAKPARTKTYRCYCQRCHGKFVCKTTFYDHNPRAEQAEEMGYQLGTPPRGIADIASPGAFTPRSPESGPSTNVILEEDTDLQGADGDQAARSDDVRVTY